MIQDDASGAELFLCRSVQNGMQLSPMNAELRIVVSTKPPARLISFISGALS
jgi:hypothetical protein